MTRLICALIAGGCAAVLVACTPPAMPEPPAGQAFFSANCSSCHGAGARGDGPLAADLRSRPTDLTVLARESGGVFPAARALSYIYGDPEDGHLARVMPQFGDVMDEDLVPIEVDGVLTPTPRALAGLLVYLESIQR